ncbi:MAG TPA: hypothetical protein VJ890_24875 [Vineibacter sp.]|nr:hypothetical protein [Vineibacter sp.]
MLKGWRASIGHALRRSLWRRVGYAAVAVVVGWYGIGYFMRTDVGISIARSLGLDPVAARISLTDSRTPEMRPIDLIVEAYRQDTKRTDRWQLRMPAAYVSYVFRKSGSEDTNKYYLDFIVGSNDPAEIHVQRLRERRKHESKETLLAANAALIRTRIKLTIGGAAITTPRERAQRQFRDIDGNCQPLGTAFDGLASFRQLPNKRELGKYSRFCQGSSIVFAAGGNPAEYDVVIACENHQNSPESCHLSALVVGGWLVEGSFHGSQLPQWRAVVRQIIDFLNKHTVANSAGLESTNLFWL